MPDFEKNLSERETTTEVEGVEEESAIEEFENSKSVKNKLAGAKDFLVQRGKEAFSWVSERFNFVKKDEESMEAELKNVEAEANEALVAAEKEIDEREEDTGDEDPGTKAGTPGAKKVEAEGTKTHTPKDKQEQEKGNRTTTREAGGEIIDIKDEDIEYEGQAGPWESMSGYIKKVEQSDKSEFRKGVEIYERMRNNFIERAEGDSLSKIDVLDTELESYKEALDELNKEIDLQREKSGEVDIEDIEQAKKLEEEIINLEEKIDIKKNKEDEGIDAEAEKEEIRQALILMYSKGDNLNSSIEKLNEELLEERNEAESKLDSGKVKNIENLQEDIDYYEQSLEKDEVEIPLDDPSVITKISKLNTKEGGKIDIIDANGEIIEGESQISVVDFLALKDKYTEMEDKSLRLKLTDQQKEILEKRKAEKEDQLSVELSNTADIKNKRDNLTEMMEIINEVQSEIDKLSKAWKEAFREAAKEFDLKSDEMTILKKMYKDKKDEFMEEQLRKLSVDEINKIDGKKSALEFIQENIKADRAA